MLAGVRTELQHVLGVIEVGDFNELNRKWIG